MKTAFLPCLLGEENVIFTSSTFLPTESACAGAGERRVCVSRRSQARAHASCFFCGGCPPRTSPRTCKSASVPQLPLPTFNWSFGVNISLSHVHIHLLLLLLFAFSWPGASDPAPYSCHPHPHTPVTLSSVPGYMHHRTSLVKAALLVLDYDDHWILLKYGG